jgi:hypothetical protein
MTNYYKAMESVCDTCHRYNCVCTRKSKYGWEETIIHDKLASTTNEPLPLPPKKVDVVNSPAHYTWLKGLEVIDITEQLSFNLGNVIKYTLRADHKGKALEDLRKAKWYLEREILRRERPPERK